MKKLFFILLTVWSLAVPAREKEVRLKIIETTDIHGNYFPYDFLNRRPGTGGLSRVCTYVRSQREALGRDAVVLLDNGDILQGQPSAYYYNFIDTTSVHVCSAMLNYMSYDAGTVGNHDIETGHPVYDRWTAACDFPVIAANATDTRTGQPYWKPYTIVERDGVRIGVLGLITPGVPTWLPEKLWASLRFDDMVRTARRYVAELRDKEHADLVVGLFHSGVGNPAATGELNENATLQVAREVAGFDLIFCGHDHRKADRWVVNAAGDSVLVLNAAAYGANVAEADVTLRYDGGRLAGKAVSGRLVDVSQLTPAPDFCRTFAAQEEAVKRFTEEVIGTNRTVLTTQPAFFGPSAFVDLIHDLQLELSGAQISFTAPISFNATIPAGDVHVSDMFNLYTYENQLYVMELTGREIKDYLEYSYGHWTRQMGNADEHMLRFRAGADTLKDAWQRLASPSYNFDSAAGLRYTVDLTKPEGQKVSILGLSNGDAFAPDATYRVAVNSYRGNGGGGLLTEGAGIPKDSLQGRIVWSTDRDLRYYLMETIRKQGTIDAKPRNDWKFVPEAWVRQAAPRDAELLFR